MYIMCSPWPHHCTEYKAGIGPGKSAFSRKGRELALWTILFNYLCIQYNKKKNRKHEVKIFLELKRGLTAKLSFKVQFLKKQEHWKCKKNLTYRDLLNIKYVFKIFNLSWRKTRLWLIGNREKKIPTLKINLNIQACGMYCTVL